MIVKWQRVIKKASYTSCVCAGVIDSAQSRVFRSPATTRSRPKKSSTCRKRRVRSAGAAMRKSSLRSPEPVDHGNAPEPGVLVGRSILNAIAICA